MNEQEQDINSTAIRFKVRTILTNVVIALNKNEQEEVENHIDELIEYISTKAIEDFKKSVTDY